MADITYVELTSPEPCSLCDAPTLDAFAGAGERRVLLCADCGDNLRIEIAFAGVDAGEDDDDEDQATRA